MEGKVSSITRQPGAKDREAKRYGSRRAVRPPDPKKKKAPNEGMRGKRKRNVNIQASYQPEEKRKE